jgi:hypothetical protein
LGTQLFSKLRFSVQAQLGSKAIAKLSLGRGFKFREIIFMHKTITLNWNGNNFLFEYVLLKFEPSTYTNMFMKKNKTVKETISNKKYSNDLRTIIAHRYSNELEQPVGEFLFRLKTNNDYCYKLFLNRFGDSTYGRFIIDDPNYL